MGEYTDYAINEMLEQENIRQDYRLGFYSIEEAFELGILDEFGTEISSKSLKASKPTKGQKLKLCGIGPCPKCGADTELKKGKYGKFYGCINYPSCKGSRNVVNREE